MVRGYNEIWTAAVGEELSCMKEKQNESSGRAPWLLSNEDEVASTTFYACHIPRGVWPAWLQRSAMWPHLIIKGKISRLVNDP